eukprot:scaffold167007_cov20-Tisochrysis_lutea.AAC.1
MPPANEAEEETCWNIARGKAWKTGRSHKIGQGMLAMASRPSPSVNCNCNIRLLRRNVILQLPQAGTADWPFLFIPCCCLPLGVSPAADQPKSRASGQPLV